jgi:homoserine O-acetyltransferase
MSGHSGPPPATGAWREGDPPGRRQWATVPGPFRLEAGGSLPEVRLAYETWGTLATGRSNAVLVLHALTGDSHVTGPAEPGHPSPGWWRELIGPGRPLDPATWYVVAPNVLGGCQGSTGPASPAPDGRPWGSRFPFLTIRDQVDAEVAVADALGITSWAAVVGGSMGGMRALEWAVSYPDRVSALLLLACAAASSAEQIAWAAPQLHAIRADPGWRGGDYYGARPGDGPHRGLGVARRIAHVTYRSEAELAARFGRRHQDGEQPWAGGRYAVESYLDHHADKLAWRFDAGSYITLAEAMNSHDIGRGRGGSAAALRRIRARTLVAGIDSDRLYPLAQQEHLAGRIPGAGSVRVITSPNGHDAFLIEAEQVGACLGELLAAPGPRRVSALTTVLVTTGLVTTGLVDRNAGGEQMDEARARSRLRAERAEVQGLLSETEAAGQQDRAAEDETGDISDPAQPLTAQGMDDAVAESLRDRLAALGRAEQRLDNGTFGRSIRSGLPIPDERLEADPAAELTVEEARAEESRARP